MAEKQVTQLIYQRKDPKSCEFIILVHPEDFKQWKANPSQIAVSQVVDAAEVFVVREGGHSGLFDRPRDSELEDIFGSKRFDDIFQFMAEHGECKTLGSHADFRGEIKYKDKRKFRS